eukprot:TRINITY_DN7523_c0_g1_i1.p2 TRINITY_DN7523_c0_g1~~TRINITY_DN7523_c0_g1_i1.p2  ORF type:complete len:222 (-),score=40.48 TRINITY_DN7523_c0_g1_i1:201-866(-)
MSACRGEHEGCGGGHDHSHDHGHSHDHSHDIEDPTGQSLYGLIDTTRVRCLNESTVGQVLQSLKPWDKRREPEPFLESNDGDPELLIHVPFTEVVKIKAISLLGGRDGAAPSKMKVWVNRDDIDFTCAEDVPGVQSMELVADSGGVEVDYPTKLHKFQNVSSVTLFFGDNHGADTTVLSFLGFRGESTNFRHGVVEAVYESKPMATDHKQPGGEVTNNSVV